MHICSRAPDVAVVRRGSETGRTGGLGHLWQTARGGQVDLSHNCERSPPYCCRVMCNSHQGEAVAGDEHGNAFARAGGLGLKEQVPLAWSAVGVACVVEQALPRWMAWACWAELQQAQPPPPLHGVF